MKTAFPYHPVAPAWGGLPLAAALFLVLLAGLSPAPLAGQGGAEPPPARILVVGTYHFHNPGLDVVQTVVPDILGEPQQASVHRVVAGLDGFRPTKVAVEHLPASAPILDSLYTAFLAGEHELARSETQQMGFRLARSAGLSRVYPVDHTGEFPFMEVVSYAMEREPGTAMEMQGTIARITEEMNRRHREWTVGEILRAMNDPAELREAHATYLRMNRIGAGDTQVGATLLARWYERNIRIFSNLQALAEPGDRILLVIGQGHVPILRELIAADPAMALEDPLRYLPER